MRISWIIIFIFYAFSALAAKPIVINQSWQNNTPVEEVVIPVEASTRSSIFSHNGYAYIVLSNKADFKATLSSNWAIIPHTNAFILRTPLANRHLTVSKKENLLRIHLGGEGKNILPSLFSLKSTEKGILIELPQSQPISFNDPNTLENLTVFTVPYIPVFMQNVYQNPEVIFAPSALGVVLISKTGKTNLTVVPEGFIWIPVNQDSLSADDALETSFSAYTQMSRDKWTQELIKAKSFFPFADIYLKDKLHTQIALLYLSRGFTQKAKEIADILKDEKLSTTIEYVQKELETPKENTSNPYTKQRYYFSNGLYQEAYDVMPYSVLGAKSLAKLTYAQINEKKIDEKKAILILEKLRTLLSEKQERTKLFETLAKLYDTQGMIFNALENERDLLALTHDEKLTQQIQKRFENIFEKSSAYTPKDRILAYYRFKELMPTGIKGFHIKERLIDDYIELDLLQEAYDLSMQTAAEQKGVLSQKTYVQAGLIAELLQNNELSQKALDLSRFQTMTDFSFISRFHPLLQAEWIKIKP